MKRTVYWTFLVFILWPFHGLAQSPHSSEPVDFPEVPRASAYEAFVQYKAGKAILLFGGGDRYDRRHILGSYNLDVDDKQREKIVQKFPKKGINIFTYCY